MAGRVPQFRRCFLAAAPVSTRLSYCSRTIYEDKESIVGIAKNSATRLNLKFGGCSAPAAYQDVTKLSSGPSEAYRARIGASTSLHVNSYRTWLQLFPSRCRWDMPIGTAFRNSFCVLHGPTPRWQRWCRGLWNVNRTCYAIAFYPIGPVVQ